MKSFYSTHILFVLLVITQKLLPMQSYRYVPGKDIVSVVSLKRAIRTNDSDYFNYHWNKIRYAFKYFSQQEREDLLYEAQANKETRADPAVNEQHWRKIKTFGVLSSVALIWSTIVLFEDIYYERLLDKADGVRQKTWQKSLSRLSTVTLFGLGMFYGLHAFNLSVNHPADKGESIYNGIVYFKEAAESSLCEETMPVDS